RCRARAYVGTSNPKPHSSHIVASVPLVATSNRTEYEPAKQIATYGSLHRPEFPRHSRGHFRAPAGAYVSVRHRNVGALFLLWNARAPGPLHGQIPAAARPCRKCRWAGRAQTRV